MTETDDPPRIEEPLPSQVRRTVSDQNQFQLPAAFVPAVGFQGAKTDLVNGAKVAWYYHEGDDKAVLGSDAADRAGLELIGACRLSGVSNKALATGDVSGARVTIISELPDELYERLTRGSVVLKPVYAGQNDELDARYVSVYPAKEYDYGRLPNVDRELREIEHDDESQQLQSVTHHANSI